MHLDDRLTIDTPEGVSIDVTLAGLGTRLGAALVDIVIQGFVLLALVLALTLAGAAVSDDIGVFLLGAGSLIIVTVLLGYSIVFEALNNGRTPGKSIFGIRVVSVDGSPLTLGAVAIRTLMRLIDFLPGAYALGAISIVATQRNQRLGDIAARTVVVRDRNDATPRPLLPTPAPSEGWDVSAVTDQELAVVRRFASRRLDLAPEPRAKLVSDLAPRLRAKVTGGERLDDEQFLLQLLAEKQQRR